MIELGNLLRGVLAEIQKFNKNAKRRPLNSSELNRLQNFKKELSKAKADINYKIDAMESESIRSSFLHEKLMEAKLNMETDKRELTDAVKEITKQSVDEISHDICETQTQANKKAIKKKTILANIESLSDQVHSLEQKKAASSNTLNDTLMEKSTKQINLTEINAKVLDLQQKHKELEDRLSSSKDDHQTEKKQFRSAMRELKSLCNSLRNELQECRLKNRSLNGPFNDVTAKVEQAQINISAIRMKIADLQMKQQETENESNLLRGDIRKSARECEVNKENLEQLQKQLREFTEKHRKRLEEIMAEETRVAQEKTRVLSEITSLEPKAKKAESELSMVQKEENTISNQLKALKNEIDNLNNQIVTTAERSAELHQETKDDKRNLAVVEQIHETTMTSLTEQMKISTKILTKEYELRLQSQASLDEATKEIHAFKREEFVASLEERTEEKRRLSEKKKSLLEDIAEKREALKKSIAACEQQLATVIEQVKQSRETIEALSPGHLALVKEAAIKEKNRELILLRLNALAAEGARLTESVRRRNIELQKAKIQSSISKKEQRLRRLDDELDANGRLSVQLKQSALQMQHHISLLWNRRSKMLKEKSAKNGMAGRETTQLNGYANEITARIRPAFSGLDSELRHLRVQMETDEMRPSP
nr:unnamed protein product [Spirometra erinaceieuropaei]